MRRLQAEGIAAAEAEQLVDTVDEERSAFVGKYFHLEWPHRSIYHAMLNTAMGVENVLQAILNRKALLEQRASG